MTEPAISPRDFYTVRIPAQFNRALREQEQAGEAGARLLADMRAVNATIRVDVESDDGGTFYLNIDGGRMEAGAKPTHPPFLTLVQDRHAFAFLARESGDSALAMLGGLSGLAGEMKLTRSRVESLEAAKGCLRFEVTGPMGFAFLSHFGTGPVPDAPDATISVDEETYRGLRGGALDPQAALLGGQLQIEGDLQLAMQLALALLSPD